MKHFENQKMKKDRPPRYRYFLKMKGTNKSPPMVSFSEIAWSWLGAFIGIAAVSYINFNIIDNTDLVMVIGSFGASAVLIYGAINSPLAQPRNLVGGHIISAIIGVTCYIAISLSNVVSILPGCSYGYSSDACHKNFTSSRRCNGTNCGDW